MTINMSSLEEVTNQLMKSVKELADWEYPLSETLGKYFSLLEHPGDINYGEAAYVVQNSTEVFTKRVDCLGKEVCNLSENFLQHEAEEEKSKSKNREKRSRKNAINFDNFELLDFSKEIGKNINLKPASQKPVKLLNRRFPQLETATTQLQNPIEVFDVNGEVIGKKYDFRCNQQLTANGMLVDECMPSDFDKIIIRASETPILQTEVSILSLTSNTIADDDKQEDTGYFTDNRNEETTIGNASEIVESNMEVDFTEDLDDPSHFDDMDHDDYTEEVENTETMENTETENTETVENTETENTQTLEITETENTQTLGNTEIENTQTLENTETENTQTLEITETENTQTVENTETENTQTVENTEAENTETVENPDKEKLNDAPESNIEKNQEETNDNLNNSSEDKTSSSTESNSVVNPVETDVNDNSQSQAIEIEKSGDSNNEKSSENIGDQENTTDNVNCQSKSTNMQKTCDANTDGNSESIQNKENGVTNVNGNCQTNSTVCQPIIANSNANKRLQNNQDQEENESTTGSCKETDSGYRSGESEDFEIPRRRSKRTKNMVCVVNDMNKNVWKPIPFDQGIPEKLPKSRTKFKLPCHISLLKSKPSSRKRKLPTEETKRKRNLVEFLSATESPLKKLNMYSPSRPFMPLKTEELSDFQKSFEDCFKSRQCYDVLHYEAATTITMDLLGFFPTFTKKDPLANSTGFKTLAPTPEHVSATCSEVEFSPRPATPEIVIFGADSPPGSPAVSESFVNETFEPDDNFEDPEDPPLHSTLNYQQMIETRMKQVHEEFDVRTDLEQNVARWHEMIRPKLEEVERRPLFHIKEYSDRILERLEETLERRMLFENLIDGQSAGDAARYFSAALQLANTNNIDIHTSEIKTDIELTLISSDTTRHEITCETPKSSRPKSKKRSLNFSL